MSEIAFDTLTGVMLGNYRLKRLIEYSQTGPVFLARFDAGAETYLLRFLDDLANAREQWHSDDLERFHYLARQMVALQHPYILPLLDYGIYHGVPSLPGHSKSYY